MYQPTEYDEIYSKVGTPNVPVSSISHINWQGIMFLPQPISPRYYGYFSHFIQETPNSLWLTGYDRVLYLKIWVLFSARTVAQSILDRLGI